MSLEKDTIYRLNGSYWYVDRYGFVYRISNRGEISNDASFNLEPESDSVDARQFANLKKYGVQMVPSEVNYADSQG